RALVTVPIAHWILRLTRHSLTTSIWQAGSGGSIALQLAHRRYMLALSTYSVIAPEGCAAILFRQVTEDTIAAALEILQPTAEYTLKYGIIDASITQPRLGDRHSLPVCLDALAALR